MPFCGFYLHKITNLKHEMTRIQRFPIHLEYSALQGIRGHWKRHTTNFSRKELGTQRNLLNPSDPIVHIMLRHVPSGSIVIHDRYRKGKSTQESRSKDAIPWSYSWHCMSRDVDVRCHLIGITHLTFNDDITSWKLVPVRFPFCSRGSYMIWSKGKRIVPVFLFVVFDYYIEIRLYSLWSVL